MGAATYRKLPVTIEALQWTGSNQNEVWDWMGPGKFYGPLPVGDALAPEGPPARLWVDANGAWLDLEPTEWIAKDSLGYYPIKDHQFRLSYELVQEAPEVPARGYHLSDCGVFNGPALEPTPCDCADREVAR